MYFTAPKTNVLMSNISASWSEWGNFTACSVTCGIGERVRNRTCDALDPNINGTLNCNGTDTETDHCVNKPCDPIHGNWSVWSKFSDCSKSCGGGLQTRTRHCDNPSPQYGGLNCTGESTDIRNCNEHDCPGRKLNCFL